MNRKSIYSSKIIFGLTFLSGFINILGILLFDTTTSHNTGNISNLSISFVLRDIERVSKLLLCVLLFFLGSFLMGLLYYKKKDNYGYLYGHLLTFQGLSLIPFNFIHSELIIFLIALFMGMQNGIVIFFEGIKVRCTHMTGYLTDSAHEFASYFIGNRAMGRLKFYIKSILLFFMGGLVASFIFIFSKKLLLPFATILYFLMSFLIYRERKTV